MFVRIVRNKKHKNSGKSGRAATILLITVIFISFINMLVCKVAGAESLFKWAGDGFSNIAGKTAMTFYSMIAANEYNIFSYTDYLYEETGNDKTVADEFMQVISSQNNLYAYMEKNVTDIALTYYDPLYNEMDFSKVVALNEKDDTKTVADEDKKEEETTTASADEKAENAENTVSGGYVIPPVSESGITYDMEQLSDFDFLMSKLYIVPARAKVLESELVASEMLAKDMTLEGDNSKPQILIYHTHSQEAFADSVEGDESTTIVGVGEYLAEILSEVYGYNVIHCTEKFDIKGGTLDRSKAYTYAEETVQQILEDNPSIEIVIDLHRDGLAEGAEKLVTNINGKDTAKIMFFNGVSRSSDTGDIDYLYNRYKEDNLAFSFQLKLKALECYPEFTRKNYIDAYQYNLHMRPKSLLIEAGAQNNTLQEELNAMEVFAEILHRVIE